MTVKPGDLVDDFTLPNDRGGEWTLSEHSGQPTLLIFHRHLT